MKWFSFIVAVLFCGVLVPPAQLFAAEPAGFRQRVSSNDEVVKSDIAEEIRFGREVAARIIARYGIYDNAVLTKYVNLVGQVLAMNTNRPEIEFHFAILNTDEINGYAAPGGYIFVTRGALARMQDEAELAGVLAHELGHVVEKHVVRELNIRSVDQSAETGLATLIGGATEASRAAFVQAVDQALDMLFKNGYKRDDETQADRDAALFCALAGYDPAGLVRYFERINTLKGKQTEILDKTHPSFETRIAWIKGTISQEGIDAGNYKNHKERFAESIKQLK
jgi:predicted Zn-dependent protease